MYEAIEGHTGDCWFHLDKINEMYGYLAPFAAVLGLVLLYHYFKSRAGYFAMLTTIVFVFSFFAWASTKMVAFTMITSCFFYAGFGAVAFGLYDFFEKNNLKVLKPVFLILIISLSFYSLRLDSIPETHGMAKKIPYHYHDRREQLDWKNSCEQIATQLNKEEKYVVFNCPEPRQNIPFMFYNDMIGYKGFPNEDKLRLLKQKGYKAAVFDNADVPDSIRNNKDIKVITLPKFKVKKMDTVFIKPKGYQFLWFEWGGRVLCSKKDSKTRMILKTFEDGSSQLLLPEGMMATRDYNNKDNIIFVNAQFSPLQRFILLQTGEFHRKNGGIFTIRTADDVPLKVVEWGENIRATFGPGEDSFNIIIEKKKDEVY